MRKWLVSALLILVFLSVLFPVTAQDPRTISFRFEKARIGDVLNFLARLLQVNLILDPKVNQEISVRLEKVTPEEALRIILKTTGLALHKVSKNTIFISSPQRISEVSPPSFFTLQRTQAKPVYDKLKEMVSGVRLQYDESTNTIIAFADSETAGVIRQIIAALDQPSVTAPEGTVTDVVVLHYITADKAASIIQSMYGGTVSSASPAAGASQTTPIPAAQTPTGGQGPITISIDRERNALVVKTTENAFSKIKDLVALIDVPVPQVMIEARVIDVNEEVAKDLGINWQTVLTGAGLDLRTYTTPANLATTLNLLVRENKARILANSQLTTLDRQQANIFIGDQVPIITQTAIVGAAGGTPTTNVSFANVGVNLTITPQVNEDGFVTLNLKPEVSRVINIITVGGTQAPQIGTRNANTQLRVKNGTTIFLGGLIRTEERSTLTKVPLLGDIPILGQLFFQHPTKNKSNTEVVFLITPHILY